MKKIVLIVLGWLFVLLGAVGIILPILPTTPFLILALYLFSKSSPIFHKMLINNRYFGASLKQWEAHKTVSHQSKRRAVVLVVISFSVSLIILHNRLSLQIMLLVIAAILLWFIWQLDEA